MIVTKLIGGLGNQMFQYAVGRALAVRHGAILRLDVSAFAQYELHSYGLRHFQIVATELTDAERAGLGLAKNRWCRILGRLRSRESISVIRESSFAYDPALLDAPGACYLEGYWQSPKYFSDIEPLILREFTVKESLRGQNLEISKRISDCLAVSLHVRRGDYVNNERTNRYHGTCGAEYYDAAELYLRERLGAMQLFVFSDDPDWAEANLHFRSPVTVLRHNGPERNYEDLRLMTLCRHHIIANSTFSWWGAWLCQSPGKIVIAPKTWFRGANYDTSDLIPKEWIRL